MADLPSAPGRFRLALRQLGRQLRIVFSILAITLGLLAAGEVLIRWLAPQNSRVISEEGLTPGIHDEELGHLNRPGSTWVQRTPEFTVEYRINAEGLRDETPHSMPKPAGVLRLLLIGDSFAFGSASTYEQTLGARLESAIRARDRDAEVVKAGVPAYDTRKEAIYLRRLLPQYDPDIVLLVFLPNDLFTNEPLGKRVPGSAPLSTGITAPHDLTARSHLLTIGSRLALESDDVYVRLYLSTPRRDYFTSPASGVASRSLQVTEGLLAGIRDLCESRGTNLVVLSVPQQFQVISRARRLAAPGIDPDAIDAFFKNAAERTGFLWLPTLEVLAEDYRASGEDLFHRLDGHLTARGNNLVASHAARFLERHLPQRAATPP